MTAGQAAPVAMLLAFVVGLWLTVSGIAELSSGAADSGPRTAAVTGRGWLRVVRHFPWRYMVGMALLLAVCAAGIVFVSGQGHGVPR